MKAICYVIASMTYLCSCDFLAVDRYTSQIFVSVVTVEGIKVVAVDELSGTQSLYSSISSQKSTGSNDLGNYVLCYSKYMH